MGSWGKSGGIFQNVLLDSLKPKKIEKNKTNNQNIEPLLTCDQPKEPTNIRLLDKNKREDQDWLKTKKNQSVFSSQHDGKLPPSQFGTQTFSNPHLGGHWHHGIGLQTFQRRINTARHCARWKTPHWNQVFQWLRGMEDFLCFVCFSWVVTSGC